jgi:hypothetical protein
MMEEEMKKAERYEELSSFIESLEAGERDKIGTIYLDISHILDSPPEIMEPSKYMGAIGKITEMEAESAAAKKLQKQTDTPKTVAAAVLGTMSAAAMQTMPPGRTAPAIDFKGIMGIEEELAKKELSELGAKLAKREAAFSSALKKGLPSKKAGQPATKQSNMDITPIPMQPPKAEVVTAEKPVPKVAKSGGISIGFPKLSMPTRQPQAKPAIEQKPIVQIKPEPQPVTSNFIPQANFSKSEVLINLPISDQVSELEKISEGVRDGSFDQVMIKIIKAEIKSLSSNVKKAEGKERNAEAFDPYMLSLKELRKEKIQEVSRMLNL